MSTLLMSILVDVLNALPKVAADVEDAVKTAESPEAAKAKVKGILGDVTKVIGAVVGVL